MKIDEWEDLQIMARTLWGEARGDGSEGIEAVARVIINRFKAKKWFTGYRIEEGQKVADIKATCLKKAQFSCWNKNDVNYHKILCLTEKDKVFIHCLKVAEKAIDGNLPDFTNNATFYHTKQIKPKCAIHHSPCYETKNHLFYNDIK